MRYGYRRRRWGRGVLLLIAGVLVFMVVGLVVTAGGDFGQKPQVLPPTALPVPPWDSAAPGPSPSAHVTARPAAAVTDPVVVAGSEVVNGVSVGFPHSTIGAVSAADEFTTDVLSTLDPDRAAAVMRMVADPAFPGGPQEAAEGVGSERQLLGIPATGPVPQGFSFVVSPSEYQVRDATGDRVTVLLLTSFVSTTPTAGTVNKVSVFAVAMHWQGGDWKVLPTPVADYSSLDASPGSPQAAALGWRELG